MHEQHIPPWEPGVVRLSLLGQDERLAGECGAFGHSRNSFSDSTEEGTSAVAARLGHAAGRSLPWPGVGWGAGFGGAFAWRTRGSGVAPVRVGLDPGRVLVRGRGPEGRFVGGGASD